LHIRHRIPPIVSHIHFAGDYSKGWPCPQAVERRLSVVRFQQQQNFLLLRLGFW
jgi:hypothetical protein